MSKILIVEDDVDLNNAYKIILEHENHEVETAFDGDDALKKLKYFKPELIILDLLMPVKSGIEFLREYHSHADAKVIIFTNLEDSPDIKEAYKLGAERCIIKSWTAPQGLVKIVDDTLRPLSLAGA